MRRSPLAGCRGRFPWRAVAGARGRRASRFRPGGAGCSNRASGFTTIGYVETVAIQPGDLRVDAKIDTGALSSSLDAADIQPFSKDGEEWVRFTIHGNDNASRRIERPIERTVHIRRAGVPLQRRYVVNIGVCIGAYYKMAEVNLNNREGLSYRMLIGRRFLTGKFVIDPGAKHLTRPACPDR